jgi:hypothetical protein
VPSSSPSIRDRSPPNARSIAVPSLQPSLPRSLGVRPVTTAGGGAELEDRYARFALYAHPGSEAPLGWTLSNASMQDLESQLGFDENDAAFDEFRSWFRDVECTVARK